PSTPGLSREPWPSGLWPGTSPSDDRTRNAMETCDAVTPVPATPLIATIESRREHLQWAIELEHSILPSYLCALYSVDVDRNVEAAQVLTSVFVEEMLHLALAANLLNAVGGRPTLDAPHLLPGYP